MSVRATVAAAPRVARRRAVSDRGMLLVGVLLTASAAFLALTGPRVLDHAADDGVRAAVVDAGDRADISVRGVGLDNPTVQLGRAQLVRRTATAIHDAMPGALRTVITDPGASIVTRLVTPRDGDGRVVGRLAWLWRAGATGVTWTEGRAPDVSQQPIAPSRATGAPWLIETGLTRACADALGVSVGERIDLGPLINGNVALVVSGIFVPDDPADAVWGDAPWLVEPVDMLTSRQAGFLLSDASLNDLQLVMGSEAVQTTYLFRTDPGQVTVPRAEKIPAAIAAITADPATLSPTGHLSVTTELDAVLTEYQNRLRAATAQASILLAGLVSVGGLAVLLSARLLVTRRERLLMAERARGGSVASIVFRLALESVPLAAVGVGLGALGSWLVSPPVAWTWWPGVVVGVVAAQRRTGDRRRRGQALVDRTSASREPPRP